MAARKKARTKRAPKKKTARKRSAPDWSERFCARLAECGNVSAACLAAAVGRSTVYQRRDTEPAFASAMREALEVSTDALELEARRRAHDGLPRLKFHCGLPIMVPVLGPDGLPLVKDGQPVLVPYVEHEYSDTLLIFLLKAHRPKKYRERHEVKHKGTLRLRHTAEDLSDDELANIVKGEPK